MRRTYIAAVLLFSVAFATEAPLASGQGISSEAASKLSLNIYLDGTGNALVTGYAENPERLAFLNSSQYSYENKTSELYALTNALTRKEGNTWTITFESPGRYEDYRVTFYLPSDFKVKNVSRSKGLEYFLTTSNDSLTLDFQGYGVLDPAASIEYMQPLEARPPPFFRPTDLLLIILILVVGAAAFLGWRHTSRRPHGPSTEDFEDQVSVRDSAKPSGGIIPTRSLESEKSSEMKDVMAGAGTLRSNTIIIEAESTNDNAIETGALSENMAPLEPSSGQASHYEEYISSETGSPEERELEDEEEAITEAEIQDLKTHAERIEISSDMAAVMETLTPRERSILQALIDRGGRSTQRDLRYETQTPKSSLAGIINSLERRKLVTKKEWGRTNVIELSDWFLSKKRQP